MSLSNASITRLVNSAPLQQARQAIQREAVVARALAVQQIPAPTFAEAQRAAYVAEEFRKLGLKDVEIDAVYNAYGWLPAPRPNAPVLMISAHTDTVFPLETDLTYRYEEDKVYGVGLGDNSLGVAALLTLAELYTGFPDLPRDAHLCFVANTREEGLGDLGGIRAAADYLGGRLQAAIVVEGMALGRVYNAGIAVRRLKLTVTTPGGHSWLHFGTPSAIHALMRFGAQMTAFAVPENPRTTYNIGLVSGGSSINTIAACAECYIDLRSADMEALHGLETQVRDLAASLATSDIRYDFELVGDRPAGAIPDDHPIVRLAREAHEAIGMSVELDSGSTDANILLARKIPSVCVGVSYGGNAHRLDEYIETAPIEDGMWGLLLLTTATSNALAAWV